MHICRLMLLALVSRSEGVIAAKCAFSHCSCKPWEDVVLRFSEVSCVEGVAAEAVHGPEAKTPFLCTCLRKCLLLHLYISCFDELSRSISK